ncbi:MAG: ribosome maturation factor RimP [Alphaproteobacteria bacterium]|jgi:ribosome maturation factor RimP|nr:ribosome maturation factor RimP [Alphaproteobacteria bacterium]
MDIITKIRQIIEPTATDKGFEIVRLLFQGDDANRTLQIMVEKIDRTGMQIDDCEKLSKTFSALLDVEDPITSRYMLEVTSPGIDRPLVRLEDYERFKGYEAKLETLTPIEGRKRFRGKIVGIQEDNVVFLFEEKEMQISFSQVSKAKLVLTDELVAQFLKKHQA